jgi:hypothetical protein
MVHVTSELIIEMQNSKENNSFGNAGSMLLKLSYSIFHFFNRHADKGNRSLRPSSQEKRTRNCIPGLRVPSGITRVHAVSGTMFGNTESEHVPHIHYGASLHA